jgi:hypothetical protein
MFGKTIKFLFIFVFLLAPPLTRLSNHIHWTHHIR